MADVRAMTEADCAWAADLMAVRRAVYATYSPVMWRPRTGAEAVHARFLAKLVASPGTVAARTDHGFAIALPADGVVVVDDFAVDAVECWRDDGISLLDRVMAVASDRGVAIVRVVTAAADEPKVAMLRVAGLELVEQWWVRPLTAAVDEPVRGRVDEGVVRGVVGPAPPVYDPGGLVFLSDAVAETVDVTTVERVAAGRGAVLAIVPGRPGSRAADQLDSGAWTVASEWYERPCSPPRRQP